MFKACLNFPKDYFNITKKIYLIFTIKAHEDLF